MSRSHTTTTGTHVSSRDFTCGDQRFSGNITSIRCHNRYHVLLLDWCCLCELGRSWMASCSRFDCVTCHCSNFMCTHNCRESEMAHASRTKGWFHCSTSYASSGLTSMSDERETTKLRSRMHRKLLRWKRMWVGVIFLPHIKEVLVGLSVMSLTAITVWTRWSSTPPIFSNLPDWTNPLSVRSLLRWRMCRYIFGCKFGRTAGRKNFSPRVCGLWSYL